MMILGELAKQIFGTSWEVCPRRGGSDPIPTFINHCFYGIFDPFLPKISEKFTEKIPTFGEGGRGQAGWDKIPTFTNFLMNTARILDSVSHCEGFQGWLYTDRV